MAILGLNKDILKRITKELGLQTAIDKLPLDVASTIQPVLISNPERVCDIVKDRTGSGAIYTTPTNADFYLTGLSISSTSKDLAAIDFDSIYGAIASGTVVTLLGIQISSDALTTSSESLSKTINPPILMKRGVIISADINSSAGHSTLTGYTVED